MSDDGANRKIEVSVVELKGNIYIYIYIIYIYIYLLRKLKKVFEINFILILVTFSLER